MLRKRGGATASSSKALPESEVTPTEPTTPEAESAEDTPAKLVQKAIEKVFDDVPTATPGPLHVYTSSGTQFESKAKTLVECLSDLSTKVANELTAVTVKMNRGDGAEYLLKYKRNRPPSPSVIEKIRRRFVTKDFLRNWPTLAFDWEGNPCNGHHTMTGFMASGIREWEFIALLGIDPEMGPRTDTNKGRDLIDQCYYMDNFPFNGIKTKKEQRTFTATVSYIFAMLVGTECLNIGMKGYEAKKEVVQHPLGQVLLNRCVTPYIRIREMLDKAAKEQENRIYKSFQRVVFYVPAMILYMAGYKDWPEMIALADGLTRFHPLKKAHDDFMSRAKDENKGGPELTTRREQTEILHAVYTLLAYAYAADINESQLADPNRRIQVRLPLPRWGTVEDSKTGEDKEVFLWET